MQKLFPVWLLLVVLLAGCAGPRASVDEKQSFYYASSEAVFEATVDALNERALSIQAMDRENGVIRVARKGGLMNRSQSAVEVYVDEAEGGLTRVGMRLHTRDLDGMQLFRTIGWQLSQPDRPATAGRY